MSQETFVVALEHGDNRVVDFAATRAKKEGAKLHLVHVLEWSPYSFLTQEELAERHNRRKQEMARAEDAVLTPVLERLKQEGVDASGEIRYGQVVALLQEVAGEQHAAMIFVGQRSPSGLSGRLFGSVTAGIAQATTVPTVIVP